MNYFARKNEFNVFQSVQEHLFNVSLFASDFSSLPNTAKLAGLLHDIGKLSSNFQNYLIKGGKRGEVIHSQQGIFFLKSLPENDRFCVLLKEILSLVMASHHGDLSDMVSPDGESVFLDRFDKKRATVLDFDEIKQRSIEYITNFEETLLTLFISAAKEIDVICKILTQHYKNSDSANFAFGLLIKYIYSCLIDADRLDAYLFDVKEDYQPTESNWDDLIKVFENNISVLQSHSKSEISLIRSRISQMCKEVATKKTDIYNFTVPTGGGKTLSTLRFALHHAKAHNKKRIIYVIPYLSIIEQTAKTLREFLSLGEDSKVLLEHHSDVAEPKKEEDAKYAKLASSRWDSPIIVTTLVQFLETVMSSKSGKLRKFHNMQDSIIIFDEVQSLPVHSINLFNEVVSFLSKVLNTTIILCTATRPLLDKTERHNLILAQNPNLISDVSADFEKLKRTKIVIEKEKNLDEFSRFIVDKSNENKNCLVIVNTKKAAKNLFVNLTSLQPSLKIFHLSTSMCPAHRLHTLNEVKNLLENKEKFVCISTQLIEAGVDISFNCVIRSMAGLDSILQAAGRCNRNGENGELQNVYAVPYKEENLDKLIDIKQGRDITAKLVRENPEADYCENKILEKYYQHYFYERKDIMDYPTDEGGSVYAMLSTNNSGRGNYRNRTGKPYEHFLTQAFSSASSYYHTIDSNTESVVVSYGESEKMLETYKQTKSLKDKLDIIKQLNKYSISLYRGSEFENLVKKSAIRITDDEFGLKVLDKGYYSQAFGVVSEIEEKDYIV